MVAAVGAVDGGRWRGWRGEWGRRGEGLWGWQWEATADVAGGKERGGVVAGGGVAGGGVAGGVVVGSGRSEREAWW